MEQLINKGMAFLSTMNQRAQQNPQQRGPGCGFFRNFMQNNYQGCQRPQNQEKKPEEPKEKSECRMKAEEVEASEDDILEKAQFLSSYGFEFTKCYQWARTYQRLSKE